MMDAREVKEWLDTLLADDPDASVAIDEGGTCLIEVGHYCEIGGAPDDDPAEDDMERDRR